MPVHLLTTAFLSGKECYQWMFLSRDAIGSDRPRGAEAEFEGGQGGRSAPLTPLTIIDIVMPFLLDIGFRPILHISKPKISFLRNKRFPQMFAISNVLGKIRDLSESIIIL